MRVSVLFAGLLLAGSLGAGAQGVLLSPGAQMNGMAIYNACPDMYVSTRVAPSGITSSALAILPGCVYSAGSASVSGDLLSAFTTRFVSQLTHGSIFVNQATGSDSACAAGTTVACASLWEALREKSDSFIYVACPSSGVLIDGTHSAPYDYRFTDVGMVGPKVVIFNVPCKIEYPGDNVGIDTWTATGGYTGIYQTALACYPASCGAVSAVQLADGTTDGTGVTDEWGNPFPFRFYSAMPNEWGNGQPYTTGQYVWYNSYQLFQALQNNTSQTPPNGSSNANWTYLSTGSSTWLTACLSNLNSLSEGFCFDSTGGVLYVKNNGLNLTSPTNAAKLAAFYFPQGSYLYGGNQIDPRVTVYGTTLLMYNAYLDAVHYEVLEYNNSGTWEPGSLWEEYGTVFDGQSYCHYNRGGTWQYEMNSVGYACQADINNEDLGASGTDQTHIEGVNLNGAYAGDPFTWLPPGLPPVFPNNNGQSSHNGQAVFINSHLWDNYGPDVADVVNTSLSVTSTSWYVGTIVGPGNVANTGNPGGFQFGGYTTGSDSRNRTFFLDTCSSHGYTVSGTPYAISVQTGAVGYLYNCSYDGPIFYFGASPVTAYTPDAP